MTDKLFDLDDIRNDSGDAKMKQHRNMLCKMLQADSPPGDSEKLTRDCLEETEGAPCGRCGRAIRDYFYLEIISNDPRKEMMVCPLCRQKDKQYAQGEPNGQ